MTWGRMTEDMSDVDAVVKEKRSVKETMPGPPMGRGEGVTEGDAEESDAALRDALRDGEGGREEAAGERVRDAERERLGLREGDAGSGEADAEAESEGEGEALAEAELDRDEPGEGVGVGVAVGVKPVVTEAVGDGLGDGGTCQTTSSMP